ncbi:MAG TPA: hypothetical protein DDY68_02615 [Porphyromonadaceae bacterium]|nr:hypothetical protein [Porphyromonadaceae bacterium]
MAEEMKHLVEYIVELLSETDSLSVKGLGMFVIDRKPAEVREEENSIVIIPPHNDITFTFNWDTNDEQLLQFYMDCEGITAKEAGYAIEKGIASLKETLFKGNEVEIGRVGVLKLNEKDEISFKPYPLNIREDEFSELHEVELPKVGAGHIKNKEMLGVPVVRREGGEWIRFSSNIESNDEHLRFTIKKKAIYIFSVLVVLIAFLLFLFLPDRKECIAPSPEQEIKDSVEEIVPKVDTLQEDSIKRKDTIVLPVVETIKVIPTPAPKKEVKPTTPKKQTTTEQKPKAKVTTKEASKKGTTLVVKEEKKPVVIVEEIKEQKVSSPQVPIEVPQETYKRSSASSKDYIYLRTYYSEGEAIKRVEALRGKGGKAIYVEKKKEGKMEYIVYQKK